MNRVDVLPGIRSVELNTVVVHLLLKMLVRLKSEPEGAGFRFSLKWIHAVIEDVMTFIEGPGDLQPAKHLDRAEKVEYTAGLEASANPCLVSSLRCEVE